MTADRPVSEQSEHLDLDAEPPRDDPERWQREDPDRADRAGRDVPPAEQLTKPGGGGEPGDEEPTEIAEQAGSAYPAGPESDAVRIEEDQDGA